MGLYPESYYCEQVFNFSGALVSNTFVLQQMFVRVQVAALSDKKKRVNNRYRSLHIQGFQCSIGKEIVGTHIKNPKVSSARIKTDQGREWRVLGLCISEL